MKTKFQDKRYFDWLCSHVSIPNLGDTYHRVLELLWEKEFVWVIGNDDNRVQDGRDFRDLYLNQQGIEDRRSHQFTHVDGVSVLEVLIGVANRLAFLTDSNVGACAWKLIKNLRLDRFPDPVDQRKTEMINEILDTLIWRNYDPDGLGGFFPLKRPKRDQREVEIWYQMTEYIEELDPHYI